MFPQFDSGNTPAISLSLIIFLGAAQWRPAEESMPPSPKVEPAREPVREIGIHGSKTSFLVYNVKQRFKMVLLLLLLFEEPLTL